MLHSYNEKNLIQFNLGILTSNFSNSFWQVYTNILFDISVCKRNFKEPSICREKYRIHNGTLISKNELK